LNDDKSKQSEFSEKVVQIRRVTKVVTGGKRMGFRAVVVVGDKLSRVGLGVGKAGEVASAIRKGVESAKKYMCTITLSSGTIPHEIMGNFGASQVMLRPAPKGTGVIAGGAVRILLELSGIRNIVAKSIGSNNPINVAKATLNALSALKNTENESQMRGKEIKARHAEVE